jgi:hypothetical protein
MSAQILEFPHPLRLLPVAGDRRSQEFRDRERSQQRRVPLVVRYQIQRRQNPTPEEVRREYYLLECD